MRGFLVLETLVPRTRLDQTPETTTRQTETLPPPVSWLAASQSPQTPPTFLCLSHTLGLPEIPTAYQERYLHETLLHRHLAPRYQQIMDIYCEALGCHEYNRNVDSPPLLPHYLLFLLSCKFFT